MKCTDDLIEINHIHQPKDNPAANTYKENRM